MGKIENLTDEQLMTAATVELIELTKKFRDGDRTALDRAKYPEILKERGLSLGITQGFIHRIFQGEFDHVDGYEVTAMPAVEK